MNNDEEKPAPERPTTEERADVITRAASELANAEAEVEELRKVEIGLAHANHQLEVDRDRLRELVKLAEAGLEPYARGYMDPGIAKEALARIRAGKDGGKG